MYRTFYPNDNMTNNSQKDILPNEEEILNAQKTNQQTQQLKNIGFPIVALIFLIGALSFAVALSYNNMAKQVIAMYSFGDGLKGAIINFGLVVGVTLFVIWLAWKKYPTIVESKII